MFLLCYNCTGFSAADKIQIGIGIIAIIVACFIPEKIKWEQLYSQLLSDYCGYDFGAAVMGVVFFFHEDCNCDVGKIKTQYEDWFNKQFINQLKKSSNNYNSIKTKYESPNDQNLHYQRRLLTQFYYQLDLCARSPFIGKRRVQKDFTSKEANMLKILYYMNEAAVSEGVFLNIETADRLPPNAKGINVYIKHIYELLKNAKPYVR